MWDITRLQQRLPLTYDSYTMRIQEGCSFVRCAYMVQYIHCALPFVKADRKPTPDTFSCIKVGGGGRRPPPRVKSWRGKRPRCPPPPVPGSMHYFASEGRSSASEASLLDSESTSLHQGALIYIRDARHFKGTLPKLEAPSTSEAHSPHQRRPHSHQRRSLPL